VAGAELRERGRDEGRARHDVVALARAVGVDRVADEQEEVGPLPRHRAEDPVAPVHPAAEAAAPEVAAPEEGDARGLVAGGRGHELAADAPGSSTDPDRVARARPEAAEPDLAGEVLAAVGADRRGRGAGAAGGQELDRDLPRARRARPHDGRGARHVADREERGLGRQAGGDGRGEPEKERGGERQHGPRPPRAPPAAHTSGS